MGNIFNTLKLYFKAAMMGGRWTKINNIQQIKHICTEAHLRPLKNIIWIRFKRLDLW